MQDQCKISRCHPHEGRLIIKNACGTNKECQEKDLPATQRKHSKPRLALQTGSLRLRDVYSISIPLRNPACTLEQSAPRQRHGAPDTTIPKYPTRPPHPDQTAN